MNRWKKKVQKKKYVSLFTKSVVAFFVIGIIPFFIMGFAIYNAYSGNVRDTLFENLSQMTLYVGKNASDIFSEMDENSKYIYEYGITDYDYFYELMKDDEITENQRGAMITDVLRDILHLNQYIDHVMFITPDGKQYSCMRPPEIMLNESVLTTFHEQYYQEGNRSSQIIPTHTTGYYFYSKLFDFSIARNIMNTRTIETAENEILGTLYLDVNMEYLTNIISEVNFGEGHEITIIDKKLGVYVYNQHDFDIGRDVEELKPWLSQMTKGKQYLKTENSYLIYSLVPGSDWVVVDKVAISQVESSFRSIRNTTLLVLGIGVALLGAIYLSYSKRTNQPIKRLEEAMNEIQEGNLDTRVDIESNDEVGIVANGLNQMTEKLQNHIERVYVAELNQKNAELEALKTQIQPHYLYNTLDAIRMTAVTNDDHLTAEMLGNLSAQLKYLIGTNQDRVDLKAEIENIKNYFNLIRIRFENRFDLEIDIPAKLLQVKVPQLILQPAVENAVKHGLRPKEGEGRVAIYAEETDGCLEITVMDDGIGMGEESLRELKHLLESPEPGKRTGSTWENIGIKNVYDRIKLIYGEQYGLEISSYEGMGTIVKYRLPIIIGDEEDV